MTREDCGLTTLNHYNWGFKLNEERNFREGAVRKALKKVFSLGEKYVVFRTIANKNADELLRGYVKVRGKEEFEWNTREIKEEDKKKDSEDVRQLFLSNDVMDRYKFAIEARAEDTVGKKNFAHYPLVAKKNVHSLNRDPYQIFWPEIYIVTEEKEKDLKDVLNNLTDDKTFEILKEYEEPQNYHLNELEILHKKGVNPIVILNDELRLSGKELSKYIDFFAQMEDSYRWTGPVSFEY